MQRTQRNAALKKPSEGQSAADKTFGRLHFFIYFTINFFFIDVYIPP